MECVDKNTDGYTVDLKYFGQVLDGAQVSASIIYSGFEVLEQALDGAQESVSFDVTLEELLDVDPAADGRSS